jgi:hypothetical protein
MPKPLEVDPLDCARLRPVSKERSRHLLPPYSV